MKSLIKAGVALGATAMLAACAGNYDVNKVSMMADQGDAFASALHKRYVERAQFEVNEGDWSSVDFFNSRGQMAAMGNAPVPQMPSDRMLKADVKDIELAYNTLTSALNTNAPQVAPDACALSQTWFEHWMEQSAEGHQADHIANARGEFEKAMPLCKGEMSQPMPAPSLPDPIIVYFAHDSAEVTSAAMSVIERAAKAAIAADAKRAVLIGHTDRSGSSAYNMALSEKRAQAVAKALMMQGVPSAEVRASHAGETSPQVATEDGMKHRLNRRVEVMFER